MTRVGFIFLAIACTPMTHPAAHSAPKLELQFVLNSASGSIGDLDGTFFLTNRGSVPVWIKDWMAYGGAAGVDSELWLDVTGPASPGALLDNCARRRPTASHANYHVLAAGASVDGSSDFGRCAEGPVPAGTYVVTAHWKDVTPELAGPPPVGVVYWSAEIIAPPVKFDVTP
jgi:hypothetical protein